MVTVRSFIFHLSCVFKNFTTIYSQNYKPPAMHKSIKRWAFRLNAHFNYSAVPRALKLYQTVYSLITRRRSFHTFTQPLFLNDATVYTAFISNGMESFVLMHMILYMYMYTDMYITCTFYPIYMQLGGI